MCPQYPYIKYKIIQIRMKTFLNLYNTIFKMYIYSATRNTQHFFNIFEYTSYLDFSTVYN